MSRVINGRLEILGESTQIVKSARQYTKDFDPYEEYNKVTLWSLSKGCLATIMLCVAFIAFCFLLGSVAVVAL